MCCMSAVSIHFTDYPSRTWICLNSSKSYRVNVSVRILLRPSCQYPQQSDREHPATVSVPLRVATEVLHHGSPIRGPPGYNMRPAAKFLICINCKNYAVIWAVIPLIMLSRYSDSLRAGRSGDRIPVGARFSAPVQTGPGAHPASYIMGTGSFPGVQRADRSVDHPPHLAPRLKKECSYTSTPHLGLRGLLQGELHHFITVIIFPRAVREPVHGNTCGLCHIAYRSDIHAVRSYITYERSVRLHP